MLLINAGKSGTSGRQVVDRSPPISAFSCPQVWFGNQINTGALKSLMEPGSLAYELFAFDETGFKAAATDALTTYEHETVKSVCKAKELHKGNPALFGDANPFSEGSQQLLKINFPLCHDGPKLYDVFKTHVDNIFALSYPKSPEAEQAPSGNQDDRSTGRKPEPDADKFWMDPYMRRVWAIMTKTREMTELNDMANARVSRFSKFDETYQCPKDGDLSVADERASSPVCRFNVVKEVLAHAMWMVSGFHNMVGTISDFTYHAMVTTRVVADTVRNAYQQDSFDVASVMLGTFVVMTTSWRQAPLVANWDIVWKRSLEEEENKFRILPPTIDSEGEDEELSSVRKPDMACYVALRRRGVTKTQLSACIETVEAAGRDIEGTRKVEKVHGSYVFSPHTHCE